jgi:hypothetical protein
MRGQCEIGSKFSARYEYRRAEKITLFAGAALELPPVTPGKITDLSLNQSFSVFVNKLATNPI